MLYSINKNRIICFFFLGTSLYISFFHLRVSRVFDKESSKIINNNDKESLTNITNYDKLSSKIINELPRCSKITRFKKYDPDNSEIARRNKGLQPLPPFTSGDPPICKLKLSVKSPIPVILVSLGRSGSSAIWQVMSRLTGNCFEVEEYTGEDSIASKPFFNSIKEGNNGNWILGYLCKEQIKHEGKGGIIGFKWKPNKPSVFSNASVDGMRMIAHYTDPPYDDNPQIKIISSKRNMLDVILSRIKHDRMNEANLTRISHCRLDDVKCLEEHKKFGTGLHVPIENLLKKLKQLHKIQKNSEEKLEDLRVPHIKVSYEKLFNDDISKEWEKIFRFIGRGPIHNLSKELLEKAMEHVATSSPFHNVTILNYEEVRDILVGTSFEKLLH